jgi:hypothetical protein
MKFIKNIVIKMKTNISKIIFSLILLFISNTSNGDSPLTSTPFSIIYQDIEIIKSLDKTPGKLTGPCCEFLYNSKNPIDIKMALINKIGFSLNGSDNFTIFYNFLISHNLDSVTINSSADLMISLSYLKAMDNYFDVQAAFTMSKKATELDPKNNTIYTISKLINSQQFINLDWCKVYNTFYPNTNTPPMDAPLRKEASELINNYMKNYEKYCKL